MGVIARPVTDPIMILTSSVFSILLVKEGGQLELFCDTSSPYQWCMWSHNGSDHFLTVGSLQGIDIREEVGQNFTWLKSSTRCGLTMKNVGLLSAGTWRCHLGMG